jgi:hypothetical protein
LEKSKKWIKKNIFSPQKLLETMDRHGGHLSMTAISLLRTIETNGDKYIRATILPSTASIQRVCKIVNRYSFLIVPFEVGHMTQGGEYCSFKAYDVVPLMYKAYDLEQAALDDSIHINVSIDSAIITPRFTHTTLGLKMAQRTAIDPYSRQPLISISAHQTNPNNELHLTDNNLESITGGIEFSTLQSKHHCFPIKIGFAPESKETYAEFKEEFNDVKDLSSGTCKKLNGFKPIKVALNADMAANQKILGVGHATKNCKFPCHLCPIHDEHLVTPNPDDGTCALCKQL